jgi:hypothetical protein
MRLRISQAAAAIPLIGYALLWSEKLKEYFGLQEQLGDGWLTTTDRLLAIYYGALILTAAWIIFVWRCPPFIRKHASAEDYIAQQMQIQNDIGYSHAIEKLRNCLTLDSYTEKAPVTLKTSLTWQQLRERLRSPHSEFKGALWHCYYIFEDGRSPLWVLITAMLLALGTALVLLPSVEVFCLVTNRFLINL